MALASSIALHNNLVNKRGGFSGSLRREHETKRHDAKQAETAQNVS